MLRYLLITLIITVLFRETESFFSLFINQGFFGNQLDSIPLQLYQQHIYGMKEPCQPCLGTLYIYRQRIIVQLYSMDKQVEYTHYLDRKDYNHFEILASHNQSEVTVIKDMLKGDTLEHYTSWVSRTPVDGLKWQWNILFVQQAIQIKSSAVQNTYIILITALFFGLSMLITLQIFSKKKLEKITPELIYRTNTIGLYMTFLNQAVLTIYLAFILVSYLLDSQGILIKLVYYSLLVIPLAACLGISSVLMSAFVRSLRKIIKQKIISLPTFLIAFFVILIYPFIISYWPKGEIYLYYTTLPLVIQYIHSAVTKKFPCARYAIFCAIQTLFLMFLQKLIPIFHFSQLTLISMIDVILLLAVQFFVGNLIIRRLIGKQIVNMVQFTNQTRDSTYDISQTQKQKNVVTDQNLGQRSIQMK